MIETSLFVAGMNTLIQTLFGTRLPVVMGSSYAYIVPSATIALSTSRNYISGPFGDNSRQVGLKLFFRLLFGYL